MIKYKKKLKIMSPGPWDKGQGPWARPMGQGQGPSTFAPGTDGRHNIKLHCSGRDLGAILIFFNYNCLAFMVCLNELGDLGGIFK